MRYAFDEQGKLLKKTDDLGNVTTFAYDGSLLTDTVEEVQYHELQNGIVKTITPTATNGDTHLEEKLFITTEIIYPRKQMKKEMLRNTHMVTVIILIWRQR